MNQRHLGLIDEIRNISFSFLLFSIGLIPAQDYYLYVAAESEDEVHLIHFNAETEKAEISKTINVGKMPTEIDGPHVSQFHQMENIGLFQLPMVIHTVG